VSQSLLAHVFLAASIIPYILRIYTFNLHLGQRVFPFIATEGKNLICLQNFTFTFHENSVNSVSFVLRLVSFEFEMNKTEQSDLL
jgi:hypothetical protein